MTEQDPMTRAPSAWDEFLTGVKEESPLLLHTSSRPFETHIVDEGASHSAVTQNQKKTESWDG